MGIQDRDYMKGPSSRGDDGRSPAERRSEHAWAGRSDRSSAEAGLERVMSDLLRRRPWLPVAIGLVLLIVILAGLLLAKFT